MRRVALLFSSLLLASCTTSLSERTVVIFWQLPQMYTDDSPLGKQDLSEMRVYRMNPRRLVASRPGVTTVYVVRGLSSGENCFFVTAVVDTVESDDSEVVCKFIR